MRRSIERLARATRSSAHVGGAFHPDATIESWTRPSDSVTLHETVLVECHGQTEDGRGIAGTAERVAGTRMKSQGEIEAAAAEGVAHFMQTCMGRGPKAIHAHLVADMIVVRLDNVLTVAEQHLFASLEPGKGRDLFKSLRTQVVEASRERLAHEIEAATGAACVSMHHDISTVTGEEIFVFRLAEPPALRIVRKK